MLSLNEFENLLGRPESSILDFKKDFYDFSNDQDQKKTADFIKDVICFSNTIRRETGYIIFGVDELPDKSKEFHGINKDVDDAILQEKVKDKVHPRPNFHYYSIQLDELKYGVIEFPVTRYSMPIMPTIKMRGLEPGKVYYKNSTSNTEALGLEVIKINDWLKTLPVSDHSQNEDEKVNELLKSITEKDKLISTVIAEMFAVAKSYRLEELLRFCSIELQGIDTNTSSLSNDFEYRIQSIIFSPHEISINPLFFGTSNQIKKELKKMEDVYEYKMLYSYPITKIEELLKGFKNSERSIAVIGSTSHQLFPEKISKNIPLNIYLFPEDIETLLTNIRQRAIDLLMKA